jgi:hypothetical protein
LLINNFCLLVKRGKNVWPFATAPRYVVDK